MRRLALIVIAASFLAAAALIRVSSAAEFTVDKSDKGVTVKLDGQLFTEYLIDSGKKPILWPIIGPTGKPMTRPWPMDTSEVDAAKKKAKSEAKAAEKSSADKGDAKDAKAKESKPKDEKAPTTDHPWHRSMWFNYSKVDDNDLWTTGSKSGSIKHREFVDVEGGPTAKIVTTNDWLDHAGKRLCEDKRTVTCRTDGDDRIIDFDCVITASDGDVTFGDEKDGLFGVRVRDAMRVAAKNGGSFVNSEGQVDEKEAWGKPAKWIDYHGPIEEGGETLGIAILNHPDSYGYPTHWHTRDYGLFAANPFGLHQFDPQSGADGTYTLKNGDSMKFRYRVIFHKGDEKSAHIAEAFTKYANEP